MNPRRNAPAPQGKVTYRQRRLGSETSFAFGQDSLKFTVKDKTGSNTVNTQYGNIGTDHDFLVERNTWLENVGYLWLALGAVFTVLIYLEGRFMPSIWLLIGAGCVLVARLRTIRYTRIHTDNGAILVIDDAQKRTILKEIRERRIEQLRRWYDFIDANEDIGRQRARFEWLHEEGILSAEELSDRLQKIESMPRPSEIPGEFVALPPGESGTVLN
ncbi:MAG TPA: hypothetical protein PKZ76_03090 [Xanthomonadaceae bacterium]|nr:hypothetical protein [Xanthomonadaceae bacterium]